MIYVGQHFLQDSVLPRERVHVDSRPLRSYPTSSQNYPDDNINVCAVLLESIAFTIVSLSQSRDSHWDALFFPECKMLFSPKTKIFNYHYNNCCIFIYFVVLHGIGSEINKLRFKMNLTTNAFKWLSLFHFYVFTNYSLSVTCLISTVCW